MLLCSRTVLLFHTIIILLINLFILGFSTFGIIYSVITGATVLVTLLFCLLFIASSINIYSTYKVYRCYRISEILMNYTNEIILQFRGILGVAFMASILQYFSAVLFIFAIESWMSISDSISDAVLYSTLIFLVNVEII